MAYFLLPSFFLKKFARASVETLEQWRKTKVGISKLEMEGCVECGWLWANE